MKHLILLMAAGALVVSGCSYNPEKMAHIKLMKNDPPMGCQMVGDVQAEGDDMNEAKHNLRVETDEQGGNYVRLDVLNMSGGDAIAAGAAFKCSSSGSIAQPKVGANPPTQ